MTKLGEKYEREFQTIDKPYSQKFCEAFKVLSAEPGLQTDELNSGKGPVNNQNLDKVESQ